MTDTRRPRADWLDALGHLLDERPDVAGIGLADVIEVLGTC